MKFKFLLFCFILFQIASAIILSAQTAGIESGSTYKIRSLANNKLLNVSNSALANSANVDIWTDTDSDAERWVVVHLGNGIYTLQNVGTGKFLHMANGTPANSVNVDQYDNTNSNQVRWSIVNNGDASFTAKAAGNTGFAMDVSGGLSADATNVSLWTSNSATNQKWGFEKVSTRPAAPSTAIADEIFTAWKAASYDKRTGKELFPGEGFWGEAEMMEIVVDAYEVTGNQKYITLFSDMYNLFITKEGSDWMWNDYNDDITWMVIACVRAGIINNNQTFINKAKEQFDKMYARAIHDGNWLTWKQTAGVTITTTNSCIDGPAMVACCYLAQALNDNSYYNKAIAIYNWSKNKLFDPISGKVNDNYNLNGSVGNWSSTYNQGTYLGASMMLYNYTKDQSYLTTADNIAQYTKVNMYNSGVINNEEGNDLNGFKGIYMRYARRYVVDGNRPTYIPWLQLNAKVAYNNRNSQKIISTIWTTRASETVSYYPFNASTAVSCEMNCPLLTAITKNPLNTIQAESFDYIKGAIVEPCTDGTDNLGGVQNGFYTGYNNVDFGTTGVNKAEIRLSNGSGVTNTIEIRLGGPTGTLIGTAKVASTGGWGTYATISCDVSNTTGLKNVYLVYKGTGYVANVNYFRFLQEVAASAATFYKDCSFGGTAVSLNAGDYKLADLQAKGILDNDISSLKVSAAYNVFAYMDDNFLGKALTVSADNDCLVDEGWNDQITSLRIRAKGDIGVTGMSGTYTIQNRNSGMVMDVAGGNATNGTTILQWTNSGANNQKFVLNEVSFGVYSVLCVQTSKSLNVTGASTANLAKVVEWDYTGAANQKWQLEVTTDKYYKFRATNSNKILEIISAGVTAGDTIVQNDDNNQTNGQWSLIVTTALKSGSINDEKISSVIIYPNPVEYTLNIEGATQDADIEIYSLSGQKVLTSKNKNVDVSDLKKGIYSLKVKSNGDIKIFKFIKK